jgi:Domain of unknown function (DUF6852)/Domain of unknown function (DUF5606)
LQLPKRKIMEYSKIISVAGLPGLYELINTKSDGAIVRSLDDKSTRFASSRIHNFSHLESIEVYTTRENVNLAEVFQAMEKAAGSLPDTKDNGAVKKYFEKVYPDIDFERVYSSDLKQMIKWYEGLKKNEIEIKLSEPEPEEEEAVIEETEVEKEAPASSKKAEAKQKPTKKKPAKKESEEKPVKSKKESPKKEKPAKKAAQKKKK